MRKISFQRTIICAAMLLCLAACCFASEVSGVVRSKEGKPIEGVAVSSPPRLYSELKTKSDGSFKLEVQDNVIFFWHPDYRPLTKIVDANTSRVEITLEDAGASRWELPPCSAQDTSRRGNRFRLLIPKGAEFKKGRGDADYMDFFVSYGRGPDRAWLYGIDGPNATSGYPVLSNVLSSKEFSERSWRSGEFMGMDMRGRSADGKFWRYVGIFGTSIKYENVSADAAAFFDKIIDSACFENKFH